VRLLLQLGRVKPEQGAIIEYAENKAGGLGRRFSLIIAAKPLCSAFFCQKERRYEKVAGSIDGRADFWLGGLGCQSHSA
jgi:hypothetical protein